MFFLACLISILASSKGQEWTITVPQHINATLGATMIILCNFSYPKKYFTNDVQVYWKTHGEQIEINDNDKNPFIFHPNSTYVIKEFREKTKLLGDKNNGNCSLEIQNLTENALRIYMRLAVKDNYSFKKNPVSVSVFGITPATPEEATFSTMGVTQGISQMHTVIFVPISAFLVIILITGIFCFIKHKRARSLTREGSGYYANFSRTCSNQAQRGPSFKNPENKKLSQVKAIDEPVYVNTENLTGQMDQRMDQMDNVYANVDYSK